MAKSLMLLSPVCVHIVFGWRIILSFFLFSFAALIKNRIFVRENNRSV